MAIAFVMAHPGVTSAILGPRTMQHLDDLLARAEVVLDDGILERIDEVVAPGTDAGPMGAVYAPPAVTQASLRRLPLPDRAAARPERWDMGFGRPAPARLQADDANSKRL
jgi:hypothetical protein